ncbi:hypothetical protein BDK92_1988 [Micromonospora pisi]|uniref:Uncharacterized protein n=1 Tax=Micromonospora pisi TaxID=589240 RepID=A0A495JFC5_9ACTN|nr:hypothetical protein [Micromonospora pisi]RKR87696.1 hypothetical protein BDK92_1988 [Micromonospora pisi]
MPGKSNKRRGQQPKHDTAFVVPVPGREPDLTGLSVPVEWPATGTPATGTRATDAPVTDIPRADVPETSAPAAPLPVAPKSGPPLRNGRSGGVGRGQSARPARQYAFRRS